MGYLSAAHTDVGIRKKVNQDSFCLKVAATTKAGNIALAVLCDGMGGLKMGELASSFLVNAFSEWFETVLPKEVSREIQSQRIYEQWNKIILQQNAKIKEFGAKHGFTLGTTITAVMLYGDNYIAAHVGDSRLYLLDSSIHQLTKDDSLVAQKVEKGELTAEQAKTDKRRNILTQCVGASPTVIPHIFTGKARVNDTFILCSDGFRHEVSDQEIFGVLAPELLQNESVIKQSLTELIELNKQRGESDNITAVVIKRIE